MKKLFLFLAIGFIFTQCEKEPQPVETGSAWITNYNYDSDWEEGSMLVQVEIYQDGQLEYTSTIPEVWSPQTQGFEVIVLDVGIYTINARWEKDTSVYINSTEFDILTNDTTYVMLDYRGSDHHH
jgi:hypothetical protein